MKLYITIDYKSKSEIHGNIYNKPRKNQSEIYLMFSATRIDDNLFELSIRKIGSEKECRVVLDESFDGRMSGKDILFYVEQRIERLMRVL